MARSLSERRGCAPSTGSSNTPSKSESNSDCSTGDPGGSELGAVIKKQRISQN